MTLYDKKWKACCMYEPLSLCYCSFRLFKQEMISFFFFKKTLRDLFSSLCVLYSRFPFYLSASIFIIIYKRRLFFCCSHAKLTLLACLRFRTSFKNIKWTLICVIICCRKYAWYSCHVILFNLSDWSEENRRR